MKRQPRVETVRRESSLVAPSTGLPEDWTNVKLLGHGAFGKVYLYETPDGDVAVKSIKVNDSGDAVSNVRAEITRLQKAIADNGDQCHPNVLCYKNLYRDVHFMYLVTDYLHGKTLSAWIDDNEALANSDLADYLTRVREIAKTAAKGLSYLHSIGIAHRDLHPWNIMVVSDSPVETHVSLKAVLIDLGLSCLLDPAYDADKWQTCKRRIAFGRPAASYEELRRIDVRMLAAALFPAVSGIYWESIIREDVVDMVHDERIADVIQAAQNHIYSRRVKIEEAKNREVAQKIYRQLTDVVLAMLQVKNISAEDAYEDLQ